MEGELELDLSRNLGRNPWREVESDAQSLLEKGPESSLERTLTTN